LLHPRVESSKRNPASRHPRPVAQVLQTEPLSAKIDTRSPPFPSIDDNLSSRTPLGGVSLLLRNAFFTVLLLIAIPAFILLLPFILPWVAYTDWRERRTLAARTCEDCGTPFGRDEINRTRHECRDRTSAVVSAIMARGGRPRTVAIWHLTCPNCGAQFGYAPATANFFRREDAA
ncbi:hypothetical protein, partial [Rhodopirellula bahusiensis]|uniref:hypothetical protein n=1 Tax=Rhodopirellula bahusiensis TaxID=2014065 RepID=UPI0032648C5F